ncbi:MAG: oxidoreductase [Lachnospiraceae bacterium]|nr:oxidoreductase [Lachnospiraceae bacterium]
MKQTSGFISTYSADSFGVCSALFELGGMIVMHDASGCNSTYTTHDEPRWYDTDGMVYISGLTEIEAIMGDDGKLISDVIETARELRPAFIAIVGTTIPAMTGFDVNAAVNIIESETGIPAFGFGTTGMRSYIHGAEEAFLRLAERVVKKDLKKSEKTTANILGLTPLDFSVNGSVDSIREWLGKQGIEIISSWAMGSRLTDIEKAGTAHLNYVVSESGLKVAYRLKSMFGTPYKIGIPIGGEDISLEKCYSEDVNEENIITIFYKKRYDTDKKVRNLSLEQKDDICREMKNADVIVIGEGVSSKSLAAYINMKTEYCTVALTATDICEDDIKEIIMSGENLKAVIADPLFKPICKKTYDNKELKFIPVPHEAFSGRLFRNDIPDLIKDVSIIVL